MRQFTTLCNDYFKTRVVHLEEGNFWTAHRNAEAVVTSLLSRGCNLLVFPRENKVGEAVGGNQVRGVRNAWEKRATVLGARGESVQRC